MHTHGAPIAQKKPGERLAFIDIAKGLGIILIVLGHNKMFTFRFPDAADFLTAFRLPFFFFMAGVTFSVGTKTLRQVALQRADAWLKPLLVVVVISGLIDAMLGNHSLQSIALGLIYPAGFTINPLPLWFLAHLWLLYVFSTMLLRADRVLLNSPVKRIALLLLLAVSGYYMMDAFADASVVNTCRSQSEFSASLFECGLPFSADILFMTSFYFLLGNFLTSRIKYFQINTLWAVVAAIGMVVFQFGFSYTIDFNLRHYDAPILTTLQALCGIYLMLCVCTLLSRIDLAANVLRYLGGASLFILLFHLSILHIFLPLFERDIHSSVINLVLSMPVALCLSAVMWEVCKRSKFLSAMLLPRKWKRAPAAPGAMPMSPSA
ncbi:MAG: acyltransferase family protein [Duganella sp.]